MNKKKRLWSLALLLMAATTATWALTTDTDGTYLLSSAQDMRDFAALVNGGTNTANAKVMNDIDLQCSKDNPWTPIGTNDNPYKGTFDGQCHTISGLVGSQGLFGINAANGKIRCVIVNGSISTGEGAGGIVGSNQGLVTRCGFKGSMYGGYGTNNSHIGGIAAYSNGTITHCYNRGTLSARYVGGIVGSLGNNGKVQYCYNAGQLSMDLIKTSSAIVGNRYGSVSNCYTLEGSASHHGSEGYAGTVKTAEQFANGSVCYLLQNNVNTPIWGQQLGTDPYPELTDDEDLYVWQYKDSYINRTYWNDIFRYTENGDEITLDGFATSFVVPAGYQLEIPEHIGGRNITAVANNAFNGQGNVTDLTFNQHLTAIGANAFRATSINGDYTLPATVIAVGSYAFADCQQLTSFTFLGDITANLGDNVFSNCSSLTAVNVPLQYFSTYAKANSSITPTLVKTTITLPNTGVKPFSLDCPFTASEGLEMLYMPSSDNYITNGLVFRSVSAAAAGMGVVLRGEGNGTYTLTAAASATAPTDNLLAGCGSETSGFWCTYYEYDNCWLAQDVTPTTVPAQTAYLQLEDLKAYSIPLEVKPTTSSQAYGVYLNDEDTYIFYFDKYSETRGVFEGSSKLFEGNSFSAKKMVFDQSFANYRPTSLASKFKSAYYLETLENLQYLNTIDVESTKQMFYDCSNLTSIDLSTFRHNNIENMREMFAECTKLTTVNFGESFESEHLTDVGGMFRNCTSLENIDLNSWASWADGDQSLQHLQSTASMFEGCTKLKECHMEDWQCLRELTTMMKMFYNCSALENLTFHENFEGLALQDMSNMFRGCTNIQVIDLSGFWTRAVTNMNSMFAFDSSLQIVLIGNLWTTEKVTQSYSMFYECYNLVGGTGKKYSDFSTYDATLANNEGLMSLMSTTPELYAILSTDGKVLTLYNDCKKVKRRLTGTLYDSNNWLGWPKFSGSTITTALFDESMSTFSGTSMDSWFKELENLETISGWSNLNSSNVTTMANLFNFCVKLTDLGEDFSQLNTAKVTDMSGMFLNCKALPSIDLSGFNTANVTTMNQMFNSCRALTELDLSSFNTEKVTDMVSMFSSCVAATDINVSSFNTSAVTTMNSMFSYCRNLQKLDLSNFNTTNTHYFESMLEGCSHLKVLDIYDFTFSECRSVYKMFYYCNDLETIYCKNEMKMFEDRKQICFNSCNSLVGAIAYSTNTDTYKDYSTFGNPTTGYFTLKPAPFNYTVPASGIGSFSADMAVRVPKGMTAHYCTTLTTVDGGQAIRVKDLSGNVVAANTGVLLKGTPGQTYQLAMSVATPTEMSDENHLVAVVTPTHVDQVVGDYTNFALSGGQFVKIQQTTNGLIPANRAYLPLLTADVSGSRRLAMLWDDGTLSGGGNGVATDISGDLTPKDEEPAAAYWYTPDGRKLSSKPTRKGLYIVNGKKIVK